MRWCQLSNMSLIVPAVYAAYKGLFWASSALFLSMILSVIYHCDESNDFALLADVIGCAVVGSCFTFLSLNSSSTLTRWNALAMVYLSAALTCFAFAGPTDDDSYDVIHSAWHVLAAYGILAFIHGHSAGRTTTVGSLSLIHI